MNRESVIRIVEISKNEAYLSKIKGKYSTSGYYDVSMSHGSDRWRIELILKPLEKTLEKNYEGRLFEDHIEEPRVFAAVLDNKQVDWVELGYDRWNNRMRIWEFLVEEEFRRRGVGTSLMNLAVRVAKEKEARMLVLETQSCDAPAIDFYSEFGFELIGFDVAAYSNEDIEKKEVRLELGLKI